MNARRPAPLTRSSPSWTRPLSMTREFRPDTAAILHEYLRKLDDHKVTLPGPVQGWHLLRKAGLTREQRQLITTQCPNLERVKVQEAMFLVLGQDYKAAVSTNNDRRGHHGYRGKGRGYAAQEDEDYGEPAEWQHDDWSEGGYYENTVYEDGYYEDEDL